MDDYDPKYPYFYIEDPVARYMNANEEFENIEKYRTLDTVHSTRIRLLPGKKKKKWSWNDYE